MSHDIRNPLTALLGYLDLAKNGQYRSQEELQQYLDASYSKAEQLKTLTDELFRYSLVFGGRELKLDLQEYDGIILTEQLLGEPVILLQQHGFTVQAARSEKPCRVRLDVQYFKRVLDNLFDNVCKYTDPAFPVTVKVAEEDGWLRIRIGNVCKKELGAVESNHIGLRTCEAILQLLGGQFFTHRVGDDFSAEFVLPVTPPDAET